MKHEIDIIRQNVLDVVTEAYGYRELIAVHEAQDYEGSIDADLASEIFYDLGMDDSTPHQDILTIGFLMGIAHAAEVLGEEE